ncbi:hypothetical protein [Streptosporangium sp. NPDC001681]|uniref:hypothetical protein n=1 Tax=Streptosporangium sp. NPDC001681 TaxID=3154395 RepID=UPI0033268684
MSAETGPRRRGRWARLPDVEETPAAPAGVPQLGPVIFTLRYDGHDHGVDFSDLPCPRLVRVLAEGVKAYAGEGGTITTWNSVAHVLSALRMFVSFVARAEHDDDLVAADLEPDHVDAFEQALLVKYGAASPQPNVVASAMIRVLRHAHLASPEAFEADLVERIGFGARVSSRSPKPVNAYSPRVFEAIRDAALADVAAAGKRMTEGEALAATGQDPDEVGWGRLEDVLWLVANRRPLQEADTRHRGSAYQLGHVFGGVRACNRRLYLAIHDLLPFVVAVICLTGMESESVKRLRASCLVSPARGFVSIQYVKRRAKGREVKQLRVSDGGTLKQPGGLLRLALRLTERARARIGSDYLWCYHGQAGTRAAFDRHLGILAFHTDGWMASHGLDKLTDFDGTSVRLDMRRLRKSFKSQQYLKAAGVLADFTQGHTPDVAARHYADIEAHEEIHDLALEAGLHEALEVSLPAPVVLDEDGGRLDEGEPLPPEQVRAALSGESDVFLASCRDFYDSPFGSKGKACPVALWGCLECPNAVFTARHLPQVLTFLDFIERQRDELPVAEWNLRYGLAWQRIVHGVRNRFRSDQISTAWAIAEGGGAHLLLPPEFTEGVA